MPSLSPPLTSREAFLGLKAVNEDRWRTRILEALNREPTSAAHLAERLEESYHDLERRCSTLKAKGYLKFGPRVRNPSGAQAYVLLLTTAGRRWMDTGVEPVAPVRVRDLELRVIQAARESIPMSSDLTMALAALDAAQTRPLRPRDPARVLGSPRTRFLAERGFYVRSDGSVLSVRDMPSSHLEYAAGKLRGQGAGSGDVELRVLVDELKRRDHESLNAPPNPPTEATHEKQ